MRQAIALMLLVASLAACARESNGAAQSANQNAAPGANQNADPAAVMSAAGAPTNGSPPPVEGRRHRDDG